MTGSIPREAPGKGLLSGTLLTLIKLITPDPVVLVASDARPRRGQPRSGGSRVLEDWQSYKVADLGPETAPGLNRKGWRNSSEYALRAPTPPGLSRAFS